MDPEHGLAPWSSSLTRTGIGSASARWSGLGLGHGEYIDACARCGDTEQLCKCVLQRFADREHIDVSVYICIELGRVDGRDGEAKVVARHVEPRLFCTRSDPSEITYYPRAQHSAVSMYQNRWHLALLVVSVNILQILFYLVGIW